MEQPGVHSGASLEVVIAGVGDQDVGHCLTVVHWVYLHVDMTGGGGDRPKLIFIGSISLLRVYWYHVGLLPISEGGPIDGGVWPEGSDHQRSENLTLVIEEVLAPVVLVRGGGCDCGRGVGGAQIGIISGRRLLRLETGNLVLANSLRKPSEDDECRGHRDCADHDGDDGG